MIRKTLALSALLLGMGAALGASPASAGDGGSDYANCVITVDPSTFEAGDVVTVTGSGLEPDFETVIGFDGVTVGTATTDAAGSFVAEVTIPADATDGPHTISAVCDAEGNISSTDVTVSSIGVPPTTTPGTSGGPLARTGSDTEPLLVVAGIALLAGIALVLVSRRRWRAAGH